MISTKKTDEFLHENGSGKLYDDSGNEVDNEIFPLDEITEYGKYLDLKPPEKSP